MLPLCDENRKPIKESPVTIFLIILNVLVFLIFNFRNDYDLMVQYFGVVPGNIMSGHDFITLISSQFFHADFLHLLGNMWFLWIFGSAIETTLSSNKYFYFYLLAGVIASFGHVFGASVESNFIPAIGASGAISAILGVYLVKYPGNNIKVFFLLLFRPYFFSIPSFFFIMLWFGGQLIYFIFASNSQIAYSVHVVGFLFGVLFIYLYGKRNKVETAEA